MGTQTLEQGQAPGLNRQMRRLQMRAQRKRGPVRRPREIMANAAEVVANRASLLTQPERERCLSPARDGFKALREGVATFDQWAGVSSAVTMALAIEDQGKVRGLREHFEAAERALDAVWQRVEDHPGGASWGRRTTLYFDEIAAIREAVHLHDFQLQHVSVSELHQATEKARHNVRAAGGREIPAPANSLPQPTQQRLV
jgi:hypothetical protein